MCIRWQATIKLDTLSKLWVLDVSEKKLTHRV